jgi:hypothetical protein
MLHIICSLSQKFWKYNSAKAVLSFEVPQRPKQTFRINLNQESINRIIAQSNNGLQSRWDLINQTSPISLNGASKSIYARSTKHNLKWQTPCWSLIVEIQELNVKFRLRRHSINIPLTDLIAVLNEVAAKLEKKAADFDGSEDS